MYTIRDENGILIAKVDNKSAGTIINSINGEWEIRDIIELFSSSKKQ